jgi:hypothetical protein
MIRSPSLKLFASRFSEMTLEWFSCTSQKADKAFSPGKKLSPTAYDVFGEEFGFEMDEDDGLQAAYQLSRV